MSIATNETYLADVCAALRVVWPENHPNRKGHQIIADAILRWFSVVA